MMTILFTLLIFSACLVFISLTYPLGIKNFIRQRKSSPQKNKITLEDVKDCLRQGKRLLAIELYREMYGLDQRQSRLEVDLLERNLYKQDKKINPDLP